MRFTRRWRFVLVPVVVIFAVSSWAAFVPVTADTPQKTYIIPKGTWARRTAGEQTAVLPAEIRLTLGVKDILVLRNDDDVPQMFGPVLIMPGQGFELPFRIASTYLFACTFHASGQLTVEVVPAPASAWARLRWRVAEMLQPGLSV